MASPLITAPAGKLTMSSPWRAAAATTSAICSRCSGRTIGPRAMHCPAKGYGQRACTRSAPGTYARTASPDAVLGRSAFDIVVVGLLRHLGFGVAAGGLEILFALVPPQCAAGLLFLEFLRILFHPLAHELGVLGFVHCHLLLLSS